MPAPLSLETRQAIVEACLRKEGTQEQIAARFGVGVASVERYVARHRRGALAAVTDYARGRAPLLTEADREQLRALALQDRDATWAQLRDRLAQHTGTSVSPTTIGRALHAMGLHRVRPAKTARRPRPPADRSPARYQAPHRRDPRQGYPSDLTDAEWALLQPFFVARTRGFDYDPRLTLNAIFYVLRSGCAWRMMPHDFPPWDTVYSAFRRWQRDGRFARCQELLRRQVRVRSGRGESPTAAILDTQSVKTTEKGGLEATTGPSVFQEGSATSR